MIEEMMNDDEGEDEKMGMWWPGHLSCDINSTAVTELQLIIEYM